MAKRGFSLIELLVAVSISTVILGVFVQSLIGGWNAQNSQEVYSQLQRGARDTIDEVSKYGWGATTVVSSTTSGAVTYTSDASTVVLRLPPLDANGDIIVGDDYIVIRQNGTLTERIIIANPNSTRIALRSPLNLNRDTGSLTFKYYNAAGVELIPGTNDVSPARELTVTIVTSRTVGARTYSRQIETTIMLRNKGI